MEGFKPASELSRDFIQCALLKMWCSAFTTLTFLSFLVVFVSSVRLFVVVLLGRAVVGNNY